MRINGGNSDSKNRLLIGEGYDGLLNDPENVIKEAKLFGTKSVGCGVSMKFLKSLI